MYAELSEAERFPLLTPAGRSRLMAMRQHPQAPLWNWPNGEQLDAAGLERVREFAARLTAFDPTQPPAWLDEFVALCLAEVPFYRRRSAAATRLTSIPTCSRADLAPRVWEFVPDSQPLDELIVFSSSGATGFPTRTPAHPASAACGIPLIEHALRSAGLAFPRGAENMALTNIAAYRGAFTTAIVIAHLDEAGCIRVNLQPEVWRKLGDCAAYLDEFWAPVMLGDPQAFAALAQTPITRPPRVLVSSIMHLSPALESELAARYGCQVVDLYALTEAGIVASRLGAGEDSSEHEILPHDVYVEILDEHDEPCPPGARGEVTLTGGRNPFLPLLRYRTGDFASLEQRDGRRYSIDLEGRRPVCFPTSERIVHSMEVTRLARKFPLAQYHLHQGAEGRFHFGYRGGINVPELRDALFELLGKQARLSIEEAPSPTAGRRKTLVYQSLHPAAAG